MKKKLTKLLIILLCGAIVTGGITVVFYKRPQWKFLVTDSVCRIFSHKMPKEQEKTEYLSVNNMDILLTNGKTQYDQSLMLINEKYKISDRFTPDICDYKDTGVLMNTAVADAYYAISQAITDKFDNKLYISSSFRTEEEQEKIKDENGSIAAPAGTSEHEAGLALDVYVKNYGGSAFIKAKEGQFVNSKCSEYGFIIRYPYYKEAVTGYEYEPWHIRYVGFPHAEIISRNSLVLEEYIISHKPDTFYIYDEYLIIRQGTENIKVPSEYKSLTISPDNTGYYIYTFILQ